MNICDISALGHGAIVIYYFDVVMEKIDMWTFDCEDATATIERIEFFLDRQAGGSCFNLDDEVVKSNPNN